MTTTPHKHAEVIKAWADGAAVQIKDGDSWFDMSEGQQPTWRDDFEYRVKPVEADRVYPYTQLTLNELMSLWDIKAQGCGPHTKSRMIANTALRHACDNGQIVTREEFDRAVGDRRNRDLAVARAVNHVVAESGGLPDEHLIGIINGVKP